MTPSLDSIHNGMCTVLFFAAARERVGVASQQHAFAGLSVRDACAQLVQLHPALKDVVAYSRFAVNHRFVASDHVIDAGAELAIIPPVAGG